jgi:serine/threonine-protein kinase
MSERFIRCAHCGLPHSSRVKVCPTTALPIEKNVRGARRRRHTETARNRSGTDAAIGRIINQRYRIIGRLGSGGMSNVYEAEQLGIDPAAQYARVALKVLHAALIDDPEAIARLRQEAEIVSSIGHPNICAVLDLGRTAEAEPYLVMERLHGESLAERIQRAPLSFSELAPLMAQVLAALAAAHDKGVLHRDLKPENIFIEEPREGQPPRAKLLDFGVAKSIGFDIEQQRLTDTGMVMGTPYYMAPEQARGEGRLDPRVDLWAIGVILYEALSGRRPFMANNYNALLVKILTAQPRPLGALVPRLPPLVVAVVDKAMEKQRDDRFQKASELIDALATAERECAQREPRAATAPRELPSDPRAERPAGAAHYRRRTEGEVGRRSEARMPPSSEEFFEEPHEPTIQDRARVSSETAIPVGAASDPFGKPPGYDEPESPTERIERAVWDEDDSIIDSPCDTEAVEQARSGTHLAETVDEHVEDTKIFRKR